MSSSSRSTCRCEVCSHDPLPTYTRLFRCECEARFYLALPAFDRDQYLALVQKRRGKAGVYELQNAVERLLENRAFPDVVQPETLPSTRTDEE